MPLSSPSLSWSSCDAYHNIRAALSTLDRLHRPDEDRTYLSVVSQFCPRRGNLDGHFDRISCRGILLKVEPCWAGVESIARLPLGVAILAVLIGIFGFFVFLLGLILLLAVAGVVISGVGVTSVFGLTGTVAGLIIAVIGLIILGVAVGLWNQELWALVLAILVLIFYGVVDFTSGAYLSLLIVVLLLVYLAAVSRHFD